VIPNKFEYREAGSAEEAIQLLGQYGDEAKLLAGGHSLLPLMKLRLASPAVLVDIGRLGDLSYVRDGGDHVAVGALTRHRDVETAPLLAAEAPLLARVAGQVGDPQVRHRGTIGGSLAHGDPAPRATKVAPRARQAASARSRPTPSSAGSSRPPSAPTSCSPRSGCPSSPRPAGGGRS